MKVIIIVEISKKMEPGDTQLPSKEWDSILCNIETDVGFLKDIREIAQKRKAMDHRFFHQKKVEIKEHEFEKIHEQAIKHTQANIFNQNTIINFQEMRTDGDFCECGCSKEKGGPLNLFINEQRISSLGPGVVLSFFYLRHVRILVFLCFLMYGSFCAICNYLCSDETIPKVCQEESNKIYCLMKQKFNFSSIKTHTTLGLCQSILGLLLCIIWILSNRFIALLGYYRDQEIDDSLDSDSDYHVLISNLPFGEYEEAQLLGYIKYLWEKKKNQNLQTTAQFEHTNQQLRIRSIQVMYNMAECRKLLEDMSAIADQLVGYFKYDNQCLSNVVTEEDLPKYRTLKTKYLTKFRALQNMRTSFLSKPEMRRNLSASCALLGFYTQAEQKQFLKMFGTGINPIQRALLPNTNPTFKNQIISIARSPQPSDILWLNCEKKFNYIKQLAIWVITFLILYLGYALVSFVQTLPLLRSVDHVASVIILQLLNRLIWFYLSIVVSYEDNNTRTESIISSMKKSIIAQSINIIVNPLIAKLVNEKDLYGSDGLAGMALTYQFVMLGMMIIYYILNPFYLGKRLLLFMPCTRKSIIRYFCRMGKPETYQQIRPLFAFYQGPEFPVAGAYVYMTSAVFHSMFYCHLQPLILLVVTINMCFFLFIMKYMLFRRCKIPEMTCFKVFQYALFTLSIAPVYFIVGSIFFLFVDENPYWIIISVPLMVSLVIWLLSALDFMGFFSYCNEKLISAIFQEDQPPLRRTKKSHSTRIMLPVLKFAAGLITSDIIEKNWKRKQSYYLGSSVNILLQFEIILKELKDSHLTIKGAILKNFCESFCDQNSSELSVSEAESKTISEQQYDMIPVEQVTNRTNSISEDRDKMLKNIFSVRI